MNYLLSLRGNIKMTLETQTAYQLSLRDHLKNKTDLYFNLNEMHKEITFETVDDLGSNGATLRCRFGVEFVEDNERTQISLQKYQVIHPFSHEVFVTSIGTQNNNKMFGPTLIESADDLTLFVSNVIDFIRLHHKLTVGIYARKESQDNIVYEQFWGANLPFVTTTRPELEEFNYVTLTEDKHGWIPNVHVMGGDYRKVIYGLVYDKEEHDVVTSVNYSKRKPNPLWLFEREYENIKHRALMKGESLPFTMSFTCRESKELGISVTVTIKSLDGFLERTNIYSFENTSSVNANQLFNFAKIFKDCLPRYHFVKHATVGLDEISIAAKSDGIETIGNIGLTNVTSAHCQEVMDCRFKYGEKWFKLEIQHQKESDGVYVVLYVTDDLGKVITCLGDVSLLEDEYQLIGIRGYELLRVHLS